MLENVIQSCTKAVISLAGPTLSHTASAYHSLGVNLPSNVPKYCQPSEVFHCLLLLHWYSKVPVGIDPSVRVARMHHTAHSLSANECSALIDRQSHRGISSPTTGLAQDLITGSCKTVSPPLDRNLWGRVEQ